MRDLFWSTDKQLRRIEMPSLAPEPMPGQPLVGRPSGYAGRPSGGPYRPAASNTVSQHGSTRRRQTGAAVKNASHRASSS